ncbi:hypothetical protein OC00_18910, partial [Xanthomonas vasicola]|uniref:hypothetical protein n=1 Tax=Xanthomonas vasicola TaxID=56459 RepID=UPI000537EA70
MFDQNRDVIEADTATGGADRLAGGGLFRVAEKSRLIHDASTDITRDLLLRHANEQSPQSGAGSNTDHTGAVA